MKKLSLAAALLLAGIATASAHSRLRSSTPADHSTVSTPPAQVVLGFSQGACLSTEFVASNWNDGERSRSQTPGVTPSWRPASLR